MDSRQQHGFAKLTANAIPLDFHLVSADQFGYGNHRPPLSIRAAHSLIALFNVRYYCHVFRK